MKISVNTEGSEPTFYCQICRISFTPNRLFSFDGKVCSRDCNEEYQWVKTLMINGSKYSLDPKKYWICDCGEALPIRENKVPKCFVCDFPDPALPE